MLKQVITYTDFNDQERTDTLYFNLSKTKVLENLKLIDEFEEFGKNLSGEEREITTEEKQKILWLVKSFMEISYGVRSEDGLEFDQSAELWKRFTRTAAYDAFLMSLFLTPANAMAFILGVVPADIRDQAENQLKTQNLPVNVKDYGAFGDGVHDDTAAIQAATRAAASNGTHHGLDVATKTTNDTRPLWEREGRKPTPKELQAMSKEEILYAMQVQQAQK